MAGNDLVEYLIAAINTCHGQDKFFLQNVAKSLGYKKMSTSDINRLLYTIPSIEWRPGEGTKRLWFPKKNATARPAKDTSRQTLPVARENLLSKLELHAWQKRALKAWKQCKRRGIVEAVTGSGKSRMAIAAAIEMLQDGGKIAIVVPSKELMRQWKEQVTIHIKNTLNFRPKIGMLGDGEKDTLQTHDIVITTAQSGSRHYLKPPKHSLIIADECHHYGADTWSKVLEEGFSQRLGLTATYERDDNGISEYLDPYFDKVCYSLDYKEALHDKVIAEFKIAFAGISFNGEEKSEYDKADEQASRHRKKLIQEWDLPEEPFGEFIKAVHRLSNSEGEGSRLAGFYLSAFTKRRQIMAQATGKLMVIADLSPAIKAADRTIVFAQTIDAASAIVNLLADYDVNGAVLTSDMDMYDRRKVFAGFEDGQHELVAAPKLLDEGVDVPAADLAIIVATSRSRRQLIQRMGRVVRKKEDNRLARVLILYVQGTPEDPDEGAHEDFREIIMDAAADYEVFRAGTDTGKIVEYLNDWW